MSGKSVENKGRLIYECTISLAFLFLINPVHLWLEEVTTMKRALQRWLRKSSQGDTRRGSLKPLTPEETRQLKLRRHIIDRCNG